MAEPYIMHTPFGCTPGGPDRRTKIRLPSGKPLEVPVSDLEQYAGTGTKIGYEWRFYEGIDEVEAALLRAGGEYAFFRIAREQLFHPDYIDHEDPDQQKTLFNVLMNQCFESSSPRTRLDFARHTHRFLEKGEEKIRAEGNPGFGTVVQNTVLGWLLNNHIAPDRWDNFLGLAGMAKGAGHAEAEAEFTKFYDDFRAYEAWEKSGNDDLGSLPSLEENRYLANMVYYSLLISVAKSREIKGLPPSGTRQRGTRRVDKRSKHSLATSVYVERTREYVAGHCTMKAVYFEVPLLRVTRPKPWEKGTGTGSGRKRPKGEKMRRGIVFVNSDTREELDEVFPSKRLDEICTEIAVLERTMVGCMRDQAAVLYMRDHNGGAPAGDMNDIEFQYAWKAAEMKMLHPRNRQRLRIEIDELDVDPSRKGMLEDFAHRVYAELFEGEPQTEMAMAFRNIRNAYMMIYPACPRALDNIGNLFAEITAVENSPVPREARKKRRRSERLASMRERIETLKSKEPFRSLCPKLKYTPTGRMEQLGNRAFGTENPDKLSSEKVLELLGLAPSMESMEILKRGYHSIETFTTILEENGGAALIPLSGDILFMQKALEFETFDLMRRNIGGMKFGPNAAI